MMTLNSQSVHESMNDDGRIIRRPKQGDYDIKDGWSLDSLDGYESFKRMQSEIDVGLQHTSHTKGDPSMSNDKYLYWDNANGVYRVSRSINNLEAKVADSDDIKAYYEERYTDIFEDYNDDTDTIEKNSSISGETYMVHEREAPSEPKEKVEPGFYDAVMTNHEWSLSPIEQLFQDDYVDLDVGTEKLEDDMELFFEKQETFKQRNMVHKRSSLLYGPPGTGKCIERDTRMYLPSGKQVTAEWVYENEPDKVLSFDDSSGKIKPSKVNDYLDTGVQKTFEVTTRRGYSVKVTKEHPFLTPEGWESIENGLNEDDFIAVSSEYNYETTNTMPREEVEFLALMIAEGALTGKSAKFSTGNSDIIELAEEIADHFDNIELHHLVDYDYYFRKVETMPKKNKCIDLLRDCGLFGKRSKDKFIPDCIFTLEKNLIRRFIEVLFSTDGWYEVRTNPLFGYSSASKELIDGLRHLLLRFGIVPNYRVKGTDCEDSHSLILTGKQAWEFFQEFDLIDDKEPNEDEFGTDNFNRNWSNIRLSSNKLDKLAEMTRKERWGEGESREELVDRLDLKTQANHFCPHRLKNKGLPQEDFEKLSNDFDDELFDYFWEGSDVVYDEIESIEEVGQSQMYDFEIEGTHSFIANDMVVHNTFSSLHACKKAVREYDALVILTPPSDVDYSSFTSTLREPLEHRNIIFIIEEMTEAQKCKDEILNFLDGEKTWNHSYTIGTTNYPEQLEKNIVDRPGRFDNVIEVDTPDADMRRKYLESVTDREFSDEAIEATDGYSIAYLKELVLRMELYDKSLKEVVDEFKELKSEIDDNFRGSDSKAGLV